MPTPVKKPCLPIPPQWAEKLLALSLPAEFREQMIGDLHEEFQQQQVPSHGVLKAHCWYYSQMLQSIYVYLNKQKEGVMGFIISTILFFALLTLAMYFGSAITDYIDMISVLVVFPPAIAFGITATSYQHFKLAIKLAISDQPDVNAAQAKGAKHCMTVTGNVAMFMGWLMTLIGWGAMASNIDSVEFEKVFGPALAVSILTLLYATVIKIICYAAGEKIQFRYMTPQE